MIFVIVRRKLSISFSLAFLLLGVLVLPALAQGPADDPGDSEDPTAVGLILFEAIPGDNEVALTWETGSESGTAGFIINRSSDSENGPFAQVVDLGNEQDGINDGFIEARGNPQQGAIYIGVDSSAENGETYWYQLVEVLQDNTQEPLAVVEVVVEPPGIIPTLGSGGTSTSAPTSTDIPTNTPIPSETPTPTNTPTPSDTPIPAPADTGIPPTATVTPRPAGPTPTQFVFPSPTPAGGVIGGGAGVAAAAGQPGQEGYPGSGITPTPFANVTIPAQTNNGVQIQNSSPYPSTGGESDLNGSGLTAPGSGDARGIEDSTGGEAAGEESAQEAESGTTSSRMILWLGLAGGLLILAGGVFFSIALATRRA